MLLGLLLSVINAIRIFTVIGVTRVFRVIRVLRVIRVIREIRDIGISRQLEGALINVADETVEPSFEVNGLESTQHNQHESK